MADWMTPQQRSRQMARIRGRDNKPEIWVRKCLHALGFRFRLHRKDLPGRPDIVLPRWRVAIFVNGCFWHGHPCGRSKTPETRRDFWENKIFKNVERDQISKSRLLADGWRVLIIWGCLIEGKIRLSPVVVGEAISDFIRSDGKSSEISGGDR